MLLVQALVTALLSGLFSGAIMFALNERRDRANLLLSKIEEAISSYTRWVSLVSRWPQDHFDMFFDGERREGRERLSALWKDAEIELNRAKMLQEIYLPDEAQAFSIVVSTYQNFISLSGVLKQASIQNRPIPDGARETITELGVALVHAGHNGKARLYAAARRYAHAPFLVRLPQIRLPKLRILFPRKPV